MLSRVSVQVVEVSARYDDTCISGNNPSQRDANLVQVLDVTQHFVCGDRAEHGLHATADRRHWYHLQCDSECSTAHEASNLSVL